MLDSIVKSCRFLLNNFPEAQTCKSYIDSRLSMESQEVFEFGYFPNATNIQALIDLVGAKDLKESKLIYHKDIEDAFCPRQITFCYFEDYPMVLPFKDAYGQVVALVGRSLLSDEDRKKKGGIPKYKNTTPFAKSNHVFGLYENKQAILDQNCVYIVEGQFDVIKAVEKGFKNIVAVGSADMSAYQFSVISRYTNNIFMLLDNDEAGEKGRKRTVDKFGKLANIRNFYLPDGYKDIDEFLSKNSFESLSFVLKD
jgi:DNA primase catalytic core